MMFVIGDHAAGALIGAVTALAVRAVVWPGMDMVIAMLIGMGIGTVIHLVVGLLLTPLLGVGETMIPAMVIGMYGGMLFGMRDSMAAGSLTPASAAVVGAFFGVLAVLGVKIYDRALRGAVVDTGE